MKIETREENGINIVLIEGEMDTITSPDVESELNKLQSSGTQKLLLNFEKLDFISSAGLRVLLATAQTLKGEGGEMRLCNLNADVKEVFDISGFSTLLQVYTTKGLALSGF